MNPFQVGLFSSLVLLFAILGALEIGRFLGARHMARYPERARPGLGAIEGSVFGLLGLLIAFTFSGAATRFEARKHLVVEEVNAISTAWLRLELLPTAAQAPLRAQFRRYLDDRIQFYKVLQDRPAARAAAAQARIMQGEIWTEALAACQASGAVPPATLLLPALNQMFDLTTTREAMMQYGHPPVIVYVMLFSLNVICALLAGYAMAGAKERSWVHFVGFALIMAIATYVILDLEFPRLGLITVDAIDQLFVELRQSMK